MLVRRFMTSPVFTLAAETNVAAALKAMQERGVRRAPVLERGALAGMVTENALRAVLPGTAALLDTDAGRASEQIPVRQMMSARLVTVKPNATLAWAATLMQRHRIGGLPVVDAGELRGIITESDVFRALARILAPSEGMRVLLEDRPASAGKGPPDYARIAEKHGGLVVGLFRLQEGDAPRATWLCVEGGDPDALLQELWRTATVVAVERPDGPPP